MMPFPQFEAQALAIPYQYKHSRFLYSLIRWLGPTSVVEIGTHIAASAVWMARALQENGDGGHLHCIDSFCWREHDQESQWNANVDACGVRAAVTLIKGRSQEVEWPAKVDFAYIDGNHTFEVCWHDVEKAIDLGATCFALNDTVTCEGARLVGELISGDSARVEWSRHQKFRDWSAIEVNFDAGLLVALKRQPKPPVQQGNYDQWDKA